MALFLAATESFFSSLKTERTARIAFCLIKGFLQVVELSRLREIGS